MFAVYESGLIFDFFRASFSSHFLTPSIFIFNKFWPIRDTQQIGGYACGGVRVFENDGLGQFPNKIVCGLSSFDE